MHKKKWVIGASVIICLGIMAKIFIFQDTEANITEETHQHDDHDHGHEPNEARIISLTPEQIQRFDLQTQKITKSNFQHRLTFPGQIALNENHISHIVASVPGTVKEIFKGLGDTTSPGEALATLQSREMAEAKSTYIAAHKNLALKKDLMEREEKLWKQGVKSDMQYIQALNLYENIKIDLEQAKQKLLALNMSEEQIQKLPEQKNPLNLYTIDAPISGKIIARHITLGENVSNNDQLFVIANLDTVWVNLAIPAEDLPQIKKDQTVDIYARQGEKIFPGTIMYVSPVIDEGSRSGRAIIEIDNKDRHLHPGDFIKAQVVISDNASLISIPNQAIQTIDGQPYSFVKFDDKTFIARPVQIRGSDKSEFVEIISGVNEGDEILVKNTFFLKAELGKSEAEHSHDH